MRYNNNYFIAKEIKTKKITYGFFSKEGGCSKGNYDSLNCSYNSGDNGKLVTANINIAKKKLGLQDSKLKLIRQIHSNKVEIIDQKNLNEKIVADGSITENKNIALTNKKEALALLPKVAGILDKLTKTNIIHKNKASNLKSKLTKHVNTLS